MTQDQFANIYLQTLLTLNLLQDLMDQLSKTSAYQHALKQTANRLQRELDKVINRDMDMIIDINNNALYHHMDYLKSLISEISTMPADANGVVAIIIQSYKEQPSEVCNALNIKFIDTYAAVPETK